MSNKTSNFLNLHLVMTTSITNFNRDDTGAPKQLTYGGSARHRISSQAMTRPKRIAFETTADGERCTWRAKSGMTGRVLAKAEDVAAQAGAPLSDEERVTLEAAITSAITDLNQNKVKAEKAATERSKKKATAAAKKAAADAAAGKNVEEAEKPVEVEDDGGPKDTLVWLAEHELNTLAAAALAHLRSGDSFGDFVHAKGRTQSLTIAAFGRMFAFRPDLQNEAAVQRAHAFTTHSVDVEPDYFIAADDLPSASALRGAGHLDHAQFAGGVFYWYCNVDRRQLWRTWIAPVDADEIREQLTDFFTALLTAQPTGKQNTAANRTLPDAILAVPASAPVALHQAFEAGVQAYADGFRKPSVHALLNEHAHITRFSPRQFPDPAYYAGVVMPEASELGAVNSARNLDALIDMCVDWVLAGRDEPAVTSPS